MVPLLSLWLPILLATVGCFVLSSIIWMATPLHKHDYKNPGDAEGPILDFLRSRSLTPGVYFVPWCQGKPDPAAFDKLKAGPWAQLNVLPGPPNMGKMLGLWALNLFLVSLMVGYVASTSRAPGAGFMPVFQVASIAAALAHLGYTLPLVTWHGMPMSQLPGRLIDGALYSLLTAAVFAAMWPAAPVAS